MSTGRVLAGAYKGRRIYSNWSGNVYLKTGVWDEKLLNADTIIDYKLLKDYEVGSTADVLRQGVLGWGLGGVWGAVLSMGLSGESKRYIIALQLSSDSVSLVELPQELYLKLIYEFLKIDARKSLNDASGVSSTNELENKKNAIVESDADRQNAELTSKDKSFWERHFIFTSILVSFFLAAFVSSISEIPVIIKIIIFNVLSFFCFFKDLNKTSISKYKWMYWPVLCVWVGWLYFLSKMLMEMR